MKMTFQPRRRQRAKVHGFETNEDCRQVENCAARRAKGDKIICNCFKLKTKRTAEPQHHVAFLLLPSEKGECFDNPDYEGFGWKLPSVQEEQ